MDPPAATSRRSPKLIQLRNEFLPLWIPATIPTNFQLAMQMTEEAEHHFKV